MASAAVRITVDEFLALPETEVLHRELVHGEIWQEPFVNAGETHEIVKSNSTEFLCAAAASLLIGSDPTFPLLPGFALPLSKLFS